MEKWLVLKYVWIASVAEWSKAMVLSTIERNCSRGFEPRRTQHTFFFGSFLLSSKDFLQRAKVLAASSVVKPPLYSSNLSTVNALYLLSTRTRESSTFSSFSPIDRLEAGRTRALFSTANNAAHKSSPPLDKSNLKLLQKTRQAALKNALPLVTEYVKIVGAKYRSRMAATKEESYFFPLELTEMIAEFAAPLDFGEV